MCQILRQTVKGVMFSKKTANNRQFRHVNSYIQGNLLNYSACAGTEQNSLKTSVIRIQVADHQEARDMAYQAQSLWN